MRWLCGGPWPSPRFETTLEVLTFLSLACCVPSGRGLGDPSSTVSSQPLLRPPRNHHVESVGVGDHPWPLNSVPILRGGGKSLPGRRRGP